MAWDDASHMHDHVNGCWCGWTHLFVVLHTVDDTLLLCERCDITHHTTVGTFEACPVKQEEVYASAAARTYMRCLPPPPIRLIFLPVPIRPHPAGAACVFHSLVICIRFASGISYTGFQEFLHMESGHEDMRMHMHVHMCAHQWRGWRGVAWRAAVRCGVPLHTRSCDRWYRVD